VTAIVWAKGNGNKYKSDVTIPMSWTVVDLSGVASVTASPAPSVSPSPGAAFMYDHSVSVTDRLVVSWSVVGTTYKFKAVLSGSPAW
jgi:hypothetical protein